MSLRPLDDLNDLNPSKTVFDRYNSKIERTKSNATPVSFEPYSDTISEFSEKHIYSQLVEIEKEQAV